MSKTTETNFWGFHGGKTGDADTFFRRKNYVAVGWPKMPDLVLLKPEKARKDWK